MEYVLLQGTMYHTYSLINEWHQIVFSLFESKLLYSTNFEATILFSIESLDEYV